MKNAKSITRKTFPKNMANLLASVEVGPDQELLPPILAQRPLIKRLAVFAKETKLHKTQSAAIKTIKEYTEEKADTAGDRAMVLWLYAVEKFAHAPTVTHALVVAYLVMPILDEYLDQVTT
ncbi:hypothetical protein BdPhPhi1402_gp06 [Bdellovibrio phage phi1402]|uniref:hypothetical protein n=1 Tax=Bdellovibrio phage phi1402 TaxID=1035662 RepID=UPI000211A2C4|nr:hypothetical protein BdPhPhi1402_gp06 [Bdellovibrio phage phi1402]AEG42303.1 hypothetical protein [Bdellovibrio phage phi1402]